MEDIWNSLNWNDILFGGFAVSLLKLVWDAVKYVINLRKTDSANLVKHQKLLNQLIDISSEFRDALSRYVYEQSPMRAFIITAKSNTTDKLVTLDPNCKVSVTVLYEIINPKLHGKLPEIKKDFQSFEVDSNYTQMLIKLVNQKSLVITPEVNNIELLKTIYDEYNVDKTFIYLLNVIPNYGISYLVLHSNDTYPVEEKSYKLIVLIERLQKLIVRVNTIKQTILKSI